MDQLSDDMIGLYEQYFEFSGIRVPFSTFLLAVIKYFHVHISQLVPLGLNRLTMFELYCWSLGVVPSMHLFRVFYKVSKQGHWFSFEKRVGKGVGGQVFRETFSRLKGWKKRFFFLDRRAIPDAMAWRHHDSDVNDLVLKDGFSASDVQTLTERVVDLRPVPSGLLFWEGLATTWDFLGFYPVFKHTEGNDNILSFCLCVWGGHSPEPLRTINHTDPSQTVTETAESRKDRSPRVSPPGSANRSVHNYSDTHVNEEMDTLRLGTSGDQSERAMMNVNTEVVQPPPMHRPARHSPTATRSASPSRSIQRATQEESNALNNATALERAWFSLVRGALAQTEILERFKHLQTYFDQLAEAHSECGETVGKLVQASPSDQELEDELARKDFALVYVERLNAKGAQEREKLVTQRGAFEADLLELMGRIENFNAYADKKMRVEYDKLFEKRYPYVEKISHGFHHPGSDLLKVYPDSPPSGQAPPDQSSSRRATSTPAP
uniref:Transposase (Putative), gypsy type n=1 Tax=Tanacetum cinerariifolium TaxID=118510 RepID=A0A699GVC5_TANCI|nr:transposase (putative), gypsy type [Tanacetum cinerariifolium]